MVSWRYEISLLVLKNISRVSAAKEWNIFLTRAEKFRISARPCNILYWRDVQLYSGERDTFPGFNLHLGEPLALKKPFLIFHADSNIVGASVISYGELMFVQTHQFEILCLRLYF